MSRSSSPLSIPMCQNQLNNTARRSFASRAGVYGSAVAFCAFCALAVNAPIERAIPSVTLAHSVHRLVSMVAAPPVRAAAGGSLFLVSVLVVETTHLNRVTVLECKRAQQAHRALAVARGRVRDRDIV